MFLRLDSDLFEGKEFVDQFMWHLYGEKYTVKVNNVGEIKFIPHAKSKIDKIGFSSVTCATLNQCFKIFK